MMVHVGSCWLLLPRSPGFNSRPVRLEFVVGKVALRQIYLLVLPLLLASISPPVLHAHTIIHHRRYIMSATDSVVK
jgi:hypothetical protein